MNIRMNYKRYWFKVKLTIESWKPIGTLDVDVDMDETIGQQRVEAQNESLIRTDKTL